MDTGNLLAMPSLSDADDFGLSDKHYNIETARRCLLNVNSKIVANVLGMQLNVINKGSKNIYFITEGSPAFITYYMECKTINDSNLHMHVTQTSVWRMLASKIPDGFAKAVVFKVLLPKYKRIMSDEIQTIKGKDFWVSLMAKSINLHTVGMWNSESKEFSNFIGTSINDYQDWLISQNAWGTLPSYMKYRFYIIT